MPETEVWAIWEDLDREGQALFGLYNSEQLANRIMAEEASHLFQPYVDRIPVRDSR